MPFVTLTCGCVIEREYGDCTCCGCPTALRRPDGSCARHE